MPAAPTAGPAAAEGTGIAGAEARAGADGNDDPQRQHQRRPQRPVEAL